ncbi:MAG: hypothetical protein GY783_00860 [Gammaproteobacteria bacterium]|nr:hypothetical protein [Gammaproteobacteria bacterium]
MSKRHDMPEPSEDDRPNAHAALIALAKLLARQAARAACGRGESSSHHEPGERDAS